MLDDFWRIGSPDCLMKDQTFSLKTVIQLLKQSRALTHKEIVCCLSSECPWRLLATKLHIRVSKSGDTKVHFRASDEGKSFAKDWLKHKLGRYGPVITFSLPFKSDGMN